MRPGWQLALQHLIDMNEAGCFQRGATGTTSASAVAAFAQGQALMLGGLTESKATIDAANPQFEFSQRQFPGGDSATATRTSVRFGLGGLSVNAHSSPQAQRAAQTFVDFVARPKQDALLVRLTGGLTQYQFLHRQLPPYMSDFSAVLANHRYVVNPSAAWWNADVLPALQQNAIGLITGQRSVDDVLDAMDSAWKQGPP
jgi:raffinose/stachyose/melibiose transport system substrate-binding protein